MITEIKPENRLLASIQPRNTENPNIMNSEGCGEIHSACITENTGTMRTGNRGTTRH